MNTIAQLQSESKTLTYKESFTTPTSTYVVKRLKNRVLPQSGQNFSPSTTRKVSFRLPAEWLDANDMFLSFKFQITSTVGADITAINAKDVEFNGSYQPFENMRITVGGVVLEDIHNLNLLEHIIHKSTGNDDYVNSPLGRAQGYRSCRNSGAENIALTPFLTAGMEMIFKPRCSGLFTSSTVVPLPYLPEVVIEFQLADANTVLNIQDAVTTGTVSYSLTDMNLHVDNLEYSQEFVNGFEASLASKPLNYYIQTFSANNQSITGPSNVAIGQFRSDLKSVFAVFRNASDINDITADSFHCGRNGITGYQLSLGSLRITQDLVENSISPYNQAKHLAYYSQTISNLQDTSLGMNMNYDDWASDTADGNGYWGIGVDLTVADAQIGGISSVETFGSPLVLDLRGATASQGTFYVQYGTVMTLNANRSIVITY